jgi:hypothetical protein
MTQPPEQPPDSNGGGEERDDELLIEQVASAHRPPSRDELRYHPAWHDLDAAGRLKAYELGRALRKLEAVYDSAGLSQTAHAVLARIEGR